MLPTVKEMSVQAESVELCYAIDRAKFAKVAIWRPSPGIEEPQSEIIIVTENAPVVTLEGRAALKMEALEKAFHIKVMAFSRN